MRRAYHVLAYVIAAEVVIQAMVMATAVAGLDHWIDDGATVNKHVIDKHPAFTGSFGFPVHAINGEMLIPLFALALLVVSFFAAVAGGTRWALYILGLIVLQVVLGVSQGDVPYLGLLHGANAFAILVVAVLAARRAAVGGPALAN
ncbi:MAG: hypothetical protein QOD07_544 [Frankiaceae bacterium]|nr:hypothetical protein [Frankiaceae bacterium]